MISIFTAFFDANAFYGARLRSLLLTLAQTKQFRARWSASVQDEWVGHLKSNRPDLDPAKIDQTRALMDAAVPDCLVTGFEPLIPALALPDPKDRHVLAAAIVCRANCIVTFNLADFPAASIANFGIHAVHPDEFLLDVHGLDADAFVRAVEEDRLRYRNPPLSLADYVASLRKSQVPKTADLIDGLAVSLGGMNP